MDIKNWLQQRIKLIAGTNLLTKLSANPRDNS